MFYQSHADISMADTVERSTKVHICTYGCLAIADEILADLAEDEQVVTTPTCHPKAILTISQLTVDHSNKTSENDYRNSLYAWERRQMALKLPGLFCGPSCRTF